MDKRGREITKILVKLLFRSRKLSLYATEVGKEASLDYKKIHSDLLYMYNLIESAIKLIPQDPEQVKLNAQ